MDQKTLADLLYVKEKEFAKKYNDLLMEANELANVASEVLTGLSPAKCLMEALRKYDEFTGHEKKTEE